MRGGSCRPRAWSTVEIHLRLSVPDRPGTLAAVAGAIGRAGGDIAAVGVVETEDGQALDDIELVVDPARLQDIVEAVRELEEVSVIYVGPSRGLPGDAVARLALGIESLLNGAMTLEHAVTTLTGGLLGASRAELLPSGSTPPSGDRVLVLDFDHQMLVVERDYRFTDSERARAAAILRTCLEAARVRRPEVSGRDADQP
ncbi:MAG: ACT domain-containing protein [Nitriliruptorales bacterium]|nr:ACT domain-containing protein [Nitriliruptorales bacterium]